MTSSNPAHFINLQATHNPHRWILPITPNVCVGPEGKAFMFGGVGLASAVMAMEKTCGRPAIWATAQYLSFAREPATLDVDVIVPVHGRFNSQARVISHVGDKEVVTVNAALGARPSEVSAFWAKMPDHVPPPEECPPRPRHARHRDGSLHDQMDVRIVKGRYGIGKADGEYSDDGHVLLWAKFRHGVPLDSAALCVIADFVPSAVSNAIGREAGGNSLDNTIRFRRIVPTDWVLCDIQIHGIHGGFVHGRMHIFAQDGELMATASQSLILRYHDNK